MNKHVLHHAYVCKTNILVKHLMCLRLLRITIKSYIKIMWLSIKTFFQMLNIFLFPSLQTVWSGRALRFLWKEDPGFWNDHACPWQSLSPRVLQMRCLSETLLRWRPLPAHQFGHCVWAWHFWVDQNEWQHIAFC